MEPVMLGFGLAWFVALCAVFYAMDCRRDAKIDEAATRRAQLQVSRLREENKFLRSRGESKDRLIKALRARVRSGEVERV